MSWDSVAHLAAIAGSVLGATWFLATKLGGLKTDIVRVETKIEPLTDLPQRVAALEVRVNQ